MRKQIALFVALAVLAGFAAVQLHAAGSGGGVTIGAAAPSFSLPDQTGKTVSLSDFTGKVVVLEWFNENCPFVKRHYQNGNGDIPQAAAKYTADGVVWLAINSTGNATDESNKQAASTWNMNRPILNDASGSVGHKYHATNTPHMFVINKDGTLAYQGAIDNDPDGDKGSDKVNYVAKALDEILANKPVSEPQTKPYGCGVHYAK